MEVNEQKLIEIVENNDERGLAPIGSSMRYEQLFYAALSVELDEDSKNSETLVQMQIFNLMIHLQTYLGLKKDTFIGGLREFATNLRIKSKITKK